MMFKSLSRRRVAPSPRPAPRPCAPSVPLLENLESRRLFAVSAGGTATIDESTPRLDVEGTRRADTINVSLNAGTGQIDVVINGGAVQSFNLAQISAGVRIDGGKGNDTITVGDGITLPVQILGDKGNDTVNGGSGAEVIDGGAGRDSCAGGGGDDVITGGNGADDLSGGAGRDSVDGGNGNDRCDGGDDSDSVTGGNGRDDLAGATGDDHLRGGNGRDRCDGGDGDDDIDGGRGRDDVRGGNGTDDFNDAPDDGPRRRGRGADDNVEDRGPGENEDEDNVTPDQVPPAVLEAFNTRYPGATIREIEREQEDQGVIIKIDFLTGGRRMRARFTEAGQFIDEEVK
jgi:Ca2+-binding RTX toxin-like protein